MATEFKRPDWTQYFMGMAFLAAARSRDAETRHGAVITDRHHLVLGTGYNSFPAGLNDAVLPAHRPEKYPFMVHAEENALLNCKVMPREVPGGAVVYITGQPCNPCFAHLLQAGVKEFYIAQRRGFFQDPPGAAEIFQQLKEQSGALVEYVPVNLEWIFIHLKEMLEM